MILFINFLFLIIFCYGYWRFHRKCWMHTLRGLVFILCMCVNVKYSEKIGTHIRVVCKFTNIFRLFYNFYMIHFHLRSIRSDLMIVLVSVVQIDKIIYFDIQGRKCEKWFRNCRFEQFELCFDYHLFSWASDTLFLRSQRISIVYTRILSYLYLIFGGNEIYIDLLNSIEINKFLFCVGI